MFSLSNGSVQSGSYGLADIYFPIPRSPNYGCLFILRLFYISLYFVGGHDNEFMASCSFNLDLCQVSDELGFDLD